MNTGSTEAGTTPAPARAAVAAEAAMNAVRAGDREGWLACFSPDAVVHDPVGGSPLDPDGEGLRGHAALALLWDLAIAPNDVEFDIASMHPAGEEVAVVAAVTTRLAAGAEVRYDGVFVYRVNEAGAIGSLNAYWDVQPLLAAMGDA